MERTQTNVVTESKQIPASIGHLEGATTILREKIEELTKRLDPVSRPVLPSCDNVKAMLKAVNDTVEFAERINVVCTDLEEITRLIINTLDRLEV
jgi:hypothetical protein